MNARAADAEHELEVAGCALLHLGGSTDPRGALTFLEGEEDVPFVIRRLFLIHHVASGQRRANHAHLAAHQAVISVAGGFEALIDDGSHRQRLTLDRPDRALHVPPQTWLTLEGFSAGAVCLVLASHPYDESEYIRDYAAFKAAAARQR